jgi:hypothetical protein
MAVGSTPTVPTNKRFSSVEEIILPAQLEKEREQAIDSQTSVALKTFWAKFDELAKKAATSEDGKSRQFDTLHLKCRLVFNAVVAIITPKLKEKGFSVSIAEPCIWNHITISWDAPSTEI